MNIIAWLEFKLLYLKDAIQHFTHYTTGTPVLQYLNSVLSFNAEIIFFFDKQLPFPAHIFHPKSLDEFNGISTSVDYLMPNPIFIYIKYMICKHIL